MDCQQSISKEVASVNVNFAPSQAGAMLFYSQSSLQLWERFRDGSEPPKQLGASRDYNVDLVPKFIISTGNLVKVLVTTDVTKYLEFKGVDGSYVLNKGRVEKVPASDYEALRSPLLGLFEKRRARNFFL